MPLGAKMVVFPTVQRVHLCGRAAYRAGVEAVRLPVLQEGGRTGSERSQTEGAEGCQTGEAGV